jgi:hypothetical protein
MRFAAILISLFISGVAVGQDVGRYLGDETALYAETKQINQFFRRFNCEEDLMGKRIYEDHPDFHNPEFRRRYIRMLFDQSNPNLDMPLVDDFVEDMTEEEAPYFLDFYGPRWFAEVSARFQYQGRARTVVLFLELEKENLGLKWVITNVYFYPFTQLFYADTTAQGKFLHPMSHELDFMNLIKVFNDKSSVEYYFQDGYKPDFTTLFLYEVKKGDLVFETIEKVSFHFFQVPGWYFELNEFNRPGNNSGWLISNLSKIPEEQKDKLLKYIYYED